MKYVAILMGILVMAGCAANNVLVKDNRQSKYIEVYPGNAIFEGSVVTVRAGWSGGTCRDGQIEWGDGQYSRDFVDCHAGDVGSSFREFTHKYRYPGRFTVLAYLLDTDPKMVLDSQISTEIAVIRTVEETD